MQKTLLWIAVVFLSATLYVQNLAFQETVQKTVRVQQALDSVRQEQFPLEVELSRYENTLEILDKEVPGVAYEFRRIMSDRTE